MTYGEASAHLLALPRFADQGAAAYRPGLERMRALCSAMGEPQEAFASVHVAGTNGKGSTASMLAAVATAAGCRTGLHTSPHLFDFTERLRVDGRPAPREWVAAAVDRFAPVFEEVGPSYFEVSVALSFLYFAEMQVDRAVVEVGLGGRLDATNVLRPELALITGIGLDHTELLGERLSDIAREKGGIIKPGVPVMTAARQIEALEALRAIARERGSSFEVLGDDFSGACIERRPGGIVVDVRTRRRRYDAVEVGLPGEHQLGNAVLAAAAAERLFGTEAEEAMRAGLARVRALSGLRGRCEVLAEEPLLVADVAHNPDGLEAALRFVQSMQKSPAGRLFVVFGVMRDKPVAAMVRHLRASNARVFPVAPATPRALEAPELRSLLHAQHVAVAEAGTVAEAVQSFQRHARPEDALLISGSHLTVAEIPEHLFVRDERNGPNPL